MTDTVSTHTRTSTDCGPDFCDECSRAIQEWVKWPCGATPEPRDQHVCTSRCTPGPCVVGIADCATCRHHDVAPENAAACVYAPCTYPPEAGSSYCTLHGVKWGRGGVPPCEEQGYCHRDDDCREAGRCLEVSTDRGCSPEAAPSSSPGECVGGAATCGGATSLGTSTIAPQQTLSAEPAASGDYPASGGGQ